MHCAQLEPDPTDPSLVRPDQAQPGLVGLDPTGSVLGTDPVRVYIQIRFGSVNPTQYIKKGKKERKEKEKGKGKGKEKE